ncbi:mannosyltransferase family protein [Streptomyces longwoodensis]|uniref:mannosyltransferase family protein n=1 Tax=Streptomyces longwoodensis TaxID=68231 RepID=UPI002DD93555|nr:mannosyltransferase family protein [Streptomyces longwoodensis]WRY87800.1 mannosyltransferase family protein [Streptomyces longwoodensis]WUC74184.1 mannosyltransferase family protein [Streptomyces longwoodensis]
MTDLETRVAPPGAPRTLRAAPALLGYAAVRALGLLALALWSAARDTSAYKLLTARWDAIWYVRVAERGYGYEVRLPNGDVHSDLAFFPLLPWLERLLHATTPLSYADAGFTVSLLASLAAAWGIFAVADRLYGRRTGVCAVLLWAVLPVGIVQSMAYSESLFTALAAWSLYAVLTGRWVTAGVLAALCGLTRPVGLAVVAAVWAAGLFPRGERAPGAARRAVGLALAPLGAAGYVLWVGHRAGGGPFGYLDVQAGWRNGFDGGRAFAGFVADKFTSLPGALAGLGLIAGVAALILLYVVGVRQRQPLALLVYTGVVLALALCASSYFGSKPRLLLPAFPLLFPLARALARLRTRGAALVTAGAAVASAVYGAWWLNGSGPP